MTGEGGCLLDLDMNTCLEIHVYRFPGHPVRQAFGQFVTPGVDTT